jgi:peptidyl-prolyl cis-trans isomerase SurA
MIKALILTVLLLLASVPARADSIVKKVNDDIITQYDLTTRTRFMLLTAGRYPDDNYDIKQMSPLVLTNLIEEKLKTQEAARIGLKVSDEDVQAMIRDIEKNNKQPPGALRKMMAEYNIPYSTFTATIRADLGWVQVIRSQYADSLKPSPDELSEYMTAHPNLTMDQAFTRIISQRLEQKAFEHMKALKRKAIIE